MAHVDLWVNKTYDKYKKETHYWQAVLSNYKIHSELLFEKNKYGKPYLSKGKNLYFNVSHTDTIAVVGVSLACEIGVDVESTNRQLINKELIANKFFHKQEKEDLEKSNNYELDFIYLWAIKEAFLKMKGIGIGYGLNNIIVNLIEENVFDIKEQKYYQYDLIIFNDNYVCCIVPKFNDIRFFIF